MLPFRFLMIAVAGWAWAAPSALALSTDPIKPPPVQAASPGAPAIKATPLATPPREQAPDAPPAGFFEESGLVPVRIDGETYRLEMLFVKPKAATGRLPVVLISHGKPATREEMAAVHATNYRTLAHDFARRGWLAVAVVRRGYGLSEGQFESQNFCKQGFNLMRQFRAEGDDLEAAMETIQQRPDVDASRIVALGVSAGGAASLALSAKAPRGLKAVINISGGLRSRQCPFDEQLVSTFRTLGELASAPSLWLYAENDSYFPPEIVARMQAAYTKASPPVTFVKTPPVTDEGHNLFSSTQGRIHWWPEVDKFFRAQNLPTWPAGLIDQVMLKNQLDPRHRPEVERYVSAPGEKALVKGGTGATLHWWAGSESAEEASRRAVAACVDRKAMPCSVILRNADAPQAAAAVGAAPARKSP